MSFRKNQLVADETLVVLTHQHALVLIWPIVLTLVAGAILIGLAYYFENYWLLLFDLIPTAFLLWKIVSRQRKEYIITNRRVVKQQGVFSLTSFDAPLDKVNNIFYEQSLLGRVFGYGNVRLETASEQGMTVFDFIPDPVAFKNSIVRQRDLYRHSSGGSPSPAGSREDIPRLLDELARLRDRNVLTAAEFEDKKKRLLDKL